jgi:hypothetical protein
MALEDYKEIVATAASITTIAQFFAGMWVYIILSSFLVQRKTFVTVVLQKFHYFSALPLSLISVDSYFTVKFVMKLVIKPLFCH